MLTTERYKELEDEAIMHYVEKHNEYIKKIDSVKLDQSGTFAIANTELLYSKAQLYASNIASYYRKYQKLYEAKAEQEQANAYERARTNKDEKCLNGSTDAQYLSRMAKGRELEKAAKYEADYIRWNGIAVSYGNAINSLKDMIKGIKQESHGGV